MPNDTYDSAIPADAPLRPVWPERTQDDWHSVREKVRTSGTYWTEDENPAVSALRYRMAPADPEPPAPPTVSGRIAAGLQSIDRMITAWEQLPERLQMRVYVGVGVSALALFVLLLMTV
jgi:hypothetical protein